MYRIFNSRIKLSLRGRSEIFTYFEGVVGDRGLVFSRYVCFCIPNPLYPRPHPQIPIHAKPSHQLHHQFPIPNTLYQHPQKPISISDESQIPNLLRTYKIILQNSSRTIYIYITSCFACSVPWYNHPSRRTRCNINTKILI